MQTATLSEIRIERNTTVFRGHGCTVHLTQCPARDGLGGVPENLPFHQITFGNGGVLLFPSAACKISDFGHKLQLGIGELGRSSSIASHRFTGNPQ